MARSKPSVVAAAIRLCAQCRAEHDVHLLEGERWQDVVCPSCQRPYGRAIEMGLDRVKNPTAAGWPSGEELEARRARAWDTFIHPSKGK
jgi:hypothetical protein